MKNVVFAGRASVGIGALVSVILVACTADPELVSQNAAAFSEAENEADEECGSGGWDTGGGGGAADDDWSGDFAPPDDDEADPADPVDPSDSGGSGGEDAGLASSTPSSAPPAAGAVRIKGSPGSRCRPGCESMSPYKRSFGAVFGRGAKEGEACTVSCVCDRAPNGDSCSASPATASGKVKFSYMIPFCAGASCTGKCK